STSHALRCVVRYALQVMRCMPVWNGQTLTFVQDRPSDKVWTYNHSNVVMPDDGALFRYSFSALKDRHNA
ncbi:phage tail protein, partial [Klebsiella pneumoniae]|uniref:phage tail protein n=1 Tax=Klebsiella pneumoniae TaxID=573 RepID=UPI001966D0AC